MLTLPLPLSWRRSRGGGERRGPLMALANAGDGDGDGDGNRDRHGEMEEQCVPLPPAAPFSCCPLLLPCPAPSRCVVALRSPHTFLVNVHFSLNVL